MLKLFSKQGFTLVELLVVVAIIGILAATALPKLLDQLDFAKRGTAKADIGAFNSALQVYSIDNANGNYSPTMYVLTTTWLGAVPQDPWKTAYTYAPSGDFKDYTIISAGGAVGADGHVKKKGWNIIYNTQLGELQEWDD